MMLLAGFKDISVLCIYLYISEHCCAMTTGEFCLM